SRVTSCTSWVGTTSKWPWAAAWSCFSASDNDPSGGRVTTACLNPAEYVRNRTLGGLAACATDPRTTASTALHSNIDLIEWPPGFLTQRTQRTNGEDAEEGRKRIHFRLRDLSVFRRDLCVKE